MKRAPVSLLLAASVTVLMGIAGVGAAGAEDARQASNPLSCDPLTGIDSLDFAPGALLLFGELHGTAEAPALLADVACWALRRGAKLRVGLELPYQETEATQIYLASAGRKDDREKLLAGSFWQRVYQDGRSSRAMAGLIEELRRLKATGRPLTVTLFDSSEPADSGQARDRAMARRLAQVADRHPSDVLLVLTGNLHARLHPGTPFDPDFEPLGYLLRKALPDRPLLAFDFSSTGGTAWLCVSAEAEDCGERSLGGKGEGDERRLLRFEQPDENGFHGTYHVGAMSASPPAVPSPEASESAQP